MSQTRASSGTVTSGPTALINPSRITIVALEITSPGFTTTLPPAKAWTPSGTGRNPGGKSYAARTLEQNKRPNRSNRRKGLLIGCTISKNSQNNTSRDVWTESRSEASGPYLVFPSVYPIFAAMQLVRDIYAAKMAARKPVISFEFFPPKTEEGDRNLLEKTIPALIQAKPDYCSVTYGAGGSTRDKTLMIVDRIQRQHGLTAVAHLTCVSSTKEQIRDLLGQIRSLGVKNVLALRGDPPNGGDFRSEEHTSE